MSTTPSQPTYNLCVNSPKGSIEPASPVVPAKVTQIDPHVHQYTIKIRNSVNFNVFALQDRPNRHGGTLTAEQLVSLWSSPANNNFRENPPNATFAGLDSIEKKQIFIPVVVTDARLIEDGKYVELSVLVNVIKSQLFPLGLGLLEEVPEDLSAKLTNINVWVDAWYNDFFFGEGAGEP